MDSNDLELLELKCRPGKEFLRDLTSVEEQLTDEHIVELLQDLARSTLIDTLRISSDLKQHYKDGDDEMEEIREDRDELFSFYNKFRKLAEDRKNDLKSMAAAIVPSEQQSRVTSDTDIPEETVTPSVAGAVDSDGVQPPGGKPINKYYKKRMVFFAQFRNILTFESCPNQSRSERIVRLIEEFETAMVTARLIAGEADEEDNSLLANGLLVSLAMSKLDEDTLALAMQHQDPAIIPTWADFREQLLRLTMENNSPE